MIVKTLFSKQFYTDPEFPMWLTAHNLSAGNSPEFSYISGNSEDIQTLLKLAFIDPKVSLCLYNWATGNYWLKTGYNLNNSTDVSGRLGFSSFIKNII